MSDAGEFGVGADATGGVEAVELGQVQVHQDYFGALARGDLDGLLAVGGFEDVVALTLKREPHREARVFVVLHDEDGRVLCSRFFHYRRRLLKGG